MNSKSETLAFEPTPAIPSFESRQYYRNDLHRMASPNSGHFGAPRPTKEVRFSPVPPLQPRAHSLATSVPLLEPISSASAVPPQWPRAVNLSSVVDTHAYMEHCRGIYERQRAGMQKEREIFDQERRMWQREREMLLGQIADLKLEINIAKGGSMVRATDASSRNGPSFRSSFNLSGSCRDNNVSANPLHTVPQPVWETPDLGSAVTRVFSGAKHNTEQGLPKISEYEISSMDGVVSPLSRPAEPSLASSVSVPIEKVDSQLDGINLKSSGLPAAVVAKVISPDTSSPNTPSPQSKTPIDLRLNVDESALQIPEPPHLRTYAGHTPLAFEGSLEQSKEASNSSTPLHPSKSEIMPDSAPETFRPVRPPNERSDSYFAGVSPPKSAVQDQIGAEERPGTVALDEDPELKGPLTLESEPQEGAENEFLNELDKKLEQAKHEDDTAVQPEGSNSGEGADELDDDMPKLRLKQNLNFGSAFGSSDFGHMR